jgi:integrase
MLTGVRPAELVNGIKVGLGGNGELIFTIRGAKTQGGLYGQQARQLTISSDAEMANYLRNIVERNGPQLVKISDARLFGNQVTAYSRKCWPRREIKISPYSFRHQFAADLKLAGDSDAVSLALGHAVANTAQHYGTARQARPTGTRLLGVATTRELKKERKLEKTRQLEGLKMRLGLNRTLARGRTRS